jgi:hypothetical protein
LLTGQLGRIRLAGEPYDFGLVAVESETSRVTPSVNTAGAVRKLTSYVRKLADPTTGIYLFVLSIDVMFNSVLFKDMLDVFIMANKLKRPWD